MYGAAAQATEGEDVRVSGSALTPPDLSLKHDFNPLRFLSGPFQRGLHRRCHQIVINTCSTHGEKSMCVRACIGAHMCVCARVCMCARVYVCAYACVCVHACENRGNILGTSPVEYLYVY